MATSFFPLSELLVTSKKINKILLLKPTQLAMQKITLEKFETVEAS